MVSETKIDNQIRDAVDVLKKGGVVMFPTETAYGLAADATNDAAVERVQAIKGRSAWKTPPLIVADRKMAEHYGLLTPILARLADKYWPGPLTIVVTIKKSENNLSKFVIRDETIALRVSSHLIASALSHGLGVPIVATSANITGEDECYRVEDVKAQFSQRSVQPDFYLDVGLLEHNPPSTIVREANGTIEVLRQGGVVL